MRDASEAPVLDQRAAPDLKPQVVPPDPAVFAWRGYYEPAGDWSGAAQGPADVEAGPGWAYDLPFELDADSGDTVVQLAVDFVIVSGTTRIPGRARLTPAISSPT